MFTNGIAIGGSIEKWQKARAAILQKIANTPVMPYNEYLNQLRQYHHLGVKIHREKQARGEAETLKTNASPYYLTTVAADRFSF